MPPCKHSVLAQKSTKMRFFFIAGLSKVTVPKNKKLQNSQLSFYIHVTREKSTNYAKFEKNLKNHLKYFKAPQG